MRAYVTELMTIAPIELADDSPPARTATAEAAG
jgi:hypothetical protein